MNEMTDTISTDAADQVVFSIPESNWAKFETEISKLSRKAEKLKLGSIIPHIIGTRMGSIEINGRDIHYKINEVMISGPMPRVSGWTFVARLDHDNHGGNIVRAVPRFVALEVIPGFQNKTAEEKALAIQNLGKPVSIPEHFRHAGPDCQHCGAKRFRRETFVLVNDQTGEFKQVGSTCLGDFLGGKRPDDIARLCEWMREAIVSARDAEMFDSEGYDAGPRNYHDTSLMTVLRHAAWACRKFGYVSAGEARRAEDERGEILTTTRSSVIENMDIRNPNRQIPTEADEKVAADALAWAQTIANKARVSDYEHNISVLVDPRNNLMIRWRDLGMAVSIIGVHLRNVSVEGSKTKLNSEGLAQLFAMFERATQSKLKSPRITLGDENTGFFVYPASSTGANAGSLYVKRNSDRAYVGKITPDGNPFIKDTNILSQLRNFVSDPETVARDHGKLTGKCCFCNTKLKTKESLDRGFGPVCYKKYVAEAV